MTTKMVTGDLPCQVTNKSFKGRYPLRSVSECLLGYLNGDTHRSRTDDLLITNQLLYQLS